MAVNTASIIQSSNLMFSILNQAQQTETELSNKIIKMAVAEKVSNPGLSPSPPGVGEALDVVL